MGPLGVPEIFFLLLIALLLFGPRKLPELGRMVGKGMAEFRRASNDLRHTIEDEVRSYEGALNTRQNATGGGAPGNSAPRASEKDASNPAQPEAPPPADKPTTDA